MYKSSTQEELWKYLTEAAHDTGTLDQHYNVATIMNSWVNQPGFPLLKVKRENDQIILSQVS